MKENEAYKNIIELLVSNGHNILQLMFTDGTSNFFSCMSFTEPMKNNLESYPYCQLVGINITDFLSLNSVMQNSQDCMYRFNDFLNTKPVLLIKFSEELKWIYWGLN